MTTRRVVAVAMTLAVVSVVSVPLPAALGAEGNFTVGGQWWDQSARDAKYQEFSEVPRGAFLENYLLREWSGRNALILWGANAIHTDQANRLTVANGVRWRADLSYLEIPHTFSHLARSAWWQGSPGAYTIDDTIQARNQANPAGYSARMTDLLNNSPVIPLGFQTNVASARLRARPVKDWQFEARGSMRTRSGSKPYAMSFGFNTAIETPEPIGQTTVDADLIGNYRHKDVTAQASVGLSSFENSFSTLRVDNPKRFTDQVGGDGAKVGALDLYPENHVVRGGLALGYLLPRQSALTGTIQISQMTQDDAFLPFTNNKALGPSNPDSLPAKSLDAKATQINGDVRLRTHPLKGLDGAVRFHYTDYNNQTDELQFDVRIPYDASIQRFGQTGSDDHTNDALSNKQWHAGVDADYSVTRAVHVGGTYEYRTRDRTEREVEKDNETVLKGRASWVATTGLRFDGHYWHGDRKLDEFLSEDYFGLRTRLATTANPAVYDSTGQLEQLALRRYDVANRVQDQAGAGASYVFSEDLELSASYSYLKNDYKDSDLGLKDETGNNVALTGTYHVNPKLDLDGGYGYGTLETNQNSRQSGHRFLRRTRSTTGART
jgi:MtrB/PioB family decaheme-associated outer membrane protein